MNTENARLEEARKGVAEWKKWGPYLSECQWGTVREDYSENGDAWARGGRRSAIFRLTTFLSLSMTPFVNELLFAEHKPPSFFCGSNSCVFEFSFGF